MQDAESSFRWSDDDLEADDVDVADLNIDDLNLVDDD